MSFIAQNLEQILGTDFKNDLIEMKFKKKDLIEIAKEVFVCNCQNSDEVFGAGFFFRKSEKRFVNPDFPEMARCYLKEDLRINGQKSDQMEDEGGDLNDFNDNELRLIEPEKTTKAKKKFSK